MPIYINLDIVLAQKGMKSNELADLVGITTANLSILKTGRQKRCDSLLLKLFVKP